MSTASASPNTRTQVAIVDDDAMVRTALSRLLCAHGYACRTYALARVALAELPSDPPDCLILDIDMPDMTGLDLQRELLKLNVCIPFVVITGCGEERVIAQAVSLGAAAFLIKPIPAEVLMAVLRGALTQRANCGPLVV